MSVSLSKDLQQYKDYILVEKAIKFIEENYREQPQLDKIAESANLSKYHFQRVFTRWAGISPKKILQYITISHAKKLLLESKSILDASYEVGLSSSSRLYDLFVNIEAITPGEYKIQGKGLQIFYGFHYTLFGECLLSVTDRGICGLSFIQNEDRQQALLQMKSQWQNSIFIEKKQYTKPVIENIFYNSNIKDKTAHLNLLLKGTNFQIKVWGALLKIPFGAMASYKDIAAMIGRPSASRTVGNAVGKNPIAFVIPCHRVIRQIGIINNYRWGDTRKKIILGWEAAKINSNKF